MSAFLVVNRQYSGQGPPALVWFEMMGALLGHAVGHRAAGLVLYLTGSFLLILVLSMACSLVGMLVILRLESSAEC